MTKVVPFSMKGCGKQPGFIVRPGEVEHRMVSFGRDSAFGRG